MSQRRDGLARHANLRHPLHAARQGVRGLTGRGVSGRGHQAERAPRRHRWQQVLRPGSARRPLPLIAADEAPVASAAREAPTAVANRGAAASAAALIAQGRPRATARRPLGHHRAHIRGPFRGTLSEAAPSAIRRVRPEPQRQRLTCAALDVWRRHLAVARCTWRWTGWRYGTSAARRRVARLFHGSRILGGSGEPVDGGGHGAPPNREKSARQPRFDEDDLRRCHEASADVCRLAELAASGSGRLRNPRLRTSLGRRTAGGSHQVRAGSHPSHPARCLPLCVRGLGAPCFEERRSRSRGLR
mmetsp:Transcript_54566/g.158518  ORF Transcript_54566/g.158518 Transcript_54566/m.158518 type:complete len:302 (-) Transcript_54566:8-913(-)